MAGFIKVISASYGRSDRTTCSSGRPSNELSNTKCHQHLSRRIMSDRCNGLPSCAVPVTNSVFSDPCAGTYTFLDVSFICLPVTFIALCQNGIEAKRSTVCEGRTAHLSCGLGFIKVRSASYGRSDKTTCSSGKPVHQISNTHCRRESSRIMSDRCNGMSSCAVPSTNSVFSDPCVGTYKYLTVSFKCLPTKRSVTCEHARSVISCARGSLSIHHANYGRRNLLTCPHKHATTSDCYHSQTSNLRSRCNGKKSCALHASNAVFSDPCYGVNKYLEVTYSCVH
ncbi:L-rhamnose-binding lectin CSL3-like [Clupea harengus]|uniref:L-rhamnose-binding lectin CSL3-like n=1 Tax=Clupea harengus TaxID=7950 RepID=A0A6P8FCH4_CLUHA|nr:L-rhamnose-binding lectin CSL3-like [Clupea harengus]